MLVINHKCIACDACKNVCPTSAIFVSDPIYEIDNRLCFLCAGYDSMACIDVCPVDAIIETNKTQHLNVLEE